MSYQPNAPCYWYSQVQFVNTNETPVHQYAVSAGGYVNSGLTLDCNQPIYSSHSSPDYNTPPYVQVYPEVHQGFSPISPLTPLSTASLSPPPSENSIAPSACLRVPENVCPYENCKSTGKFKRRTDLQRHIKTQHEADNKKDCKHTWCGRTGDNGFSRLDHYREHLREVHREEIPYKTRRESGSRSSTKNKIRKINATSAPRQILSTQHSLNF